jgi:hypothetical protein
MVVCSLIMKINGVDYSVFQTAFAAFFEMDWTR